MGSDLSQFQWDAVALRMTAFPKPGSEITAMDWWKSVVGEVPEEQTAKPRSGELIERGELGLGLLELKINPVSMTWIQRVEEPQWEEELVSLGAFQSACGTFCPLMKNWFDLDAVPNLVRLAFGADLIQSVDSKEAGYKRLASYIPAVALDPANLSDFIYQINRRRYSILENEEFAINRIMKWSVLRRQPLLDYIRLELDINTMQEFEGEFMKGQLSQLFDELVELGAEIAEKGDIP